MVISSTPSLYANLRVATCVYDVEGGAIFSKNSTFVFFDGAAWTPRLRSPSPIMAPVDIRYLSSIFGGGGGLLCEMLSGGVPTGHRNPYLISGTYMALHVIIVYQESSIIRQIRKSISRTCSKNSTFIFSRLI